MLKNSLLSNMKIQRRYRLVKKGTSISFEYQDFPIYEGVSYTKQILWRKLIMCKLFHLHDWDLFNCKNCGNKIF